MENYSKRRPSTPSLILYQNNKNCSQEESTGTIDQQPVKSTTNNRNESSFHISQSNSTTFLSPTLPLSSSQCSALVFLIHGLFGVWAFPTIPTNQVAYNNIHGCNARISKAGKFHLEGGHFGYCSIKIWAPLMHRIGITIHPSSNYECTNESFIVAMNGWMIIDRLNRRKEFVPQTTMAAAAANPRKKLICPPAAIGNNKNNNNLVSALIQATTASAGGSSRNSKTGPYSYSSDQNIAEIAYELPRGVSAEIHVAFKESTSICNNMLDMSAKDSHNKELQIQVRPSTTSTSPTSCQVYVPQGVVISIVNSSLSEGSTFTVESGNVVIKMKELLSASTLTNGQSIVSPCMHSKLTLQTSTTGSASVQTNQDFVRFTVRKTSVLERARHHRNACSSF